VGLAVPAAASAPIRFSLVAAGRTEPSGKPAPVAYLARSLAGAGPWLSRLTRSDRARVRAVSFRRDDVVAVFLDGLPCAADAAVTGMTRTGARLVVRAAYKPVPPGVALCVRTSTYFRVLGVRKTALAPPPSRIVVQARARS
jgi:hypothetical protein